MNRMSDLAFSLILLFLFLSSCEINTKEVKVDETFEMTAEFDFYFSLGRNNITGEYQYIKLPETVDLKKIIGTAKIISDIDINANIVNFRISPTTVSWLAYSTQYSAAGYKIVLTVLIHIPKGSELGEHELYAEFSNLSTLAKYLNATVVFLSKRSSGSGCSTSPKLNKEGQILFHTINIHDS